MENEFEQAYKYYCDKATAYMAEKHFASAEHYLKLARTVDEAQSLVLAAMREIEHEAAKASHA